MSDSVFLKLITIKCNGYVSDVTTPWFNFLKTNYKILTLSWSNSNSNRLQSNSNSNILLWIQLVIVIVVVIEKFWNNSNNNRLHCRVIVPRPDTEYW